MSQKTGAWFVAALAFCCLAISSARADGLIDNVNGYTIDSDNQLRRFTGLVLTVDGKVAQLLTAGQKRPKKIDWRHDGQGRTMLPGLIDSQTDLMALGSQIAGLDLGKAQHLAEAQALVRDYAAAHPERRWVLGRGWKPESWGLTRPIEAADIDAVIADRPVWLISADGETGWANSVALKLAGLTGPVQPVPGGQVEMIRGKPSGILTGAAMDLVGRFASEPLPAERDHAFAEMQYRLLAAGITSVADLGTSEKQWNSYRRAADLGKLQIRIVSYADNLEGLLSIAGSRPTPWLEKGRLRMVGLALRLDGSIWSHTAWLKQPYRDRPDYRGERRISDTRLRNLASRASMDGFKLVFQAAGDAAVEEALNVIDEVAPTYVGDRRWRIHGATIMSGTEQARLGRNNAVVSTDFVTGSTDREVLSARLGADRATTFDVFASLRSAGNRVAVASNGREMPPDPVAMMAGMRASIGSPSQILAAFTADPAYAAFSEDRLGHLLPDYRADFILLDGDPLSISGGTPPKIQVMETWIDGKRQWSRK